MKYKHSKYKYAIQASNDMSNIPVLYKILYTARAVTYILSNISLDKMWPKLFNRRAHRSIGQREKVKCTLMRKIIMCIVNMICRLGNKSDETP